MSMIRQKNVLVLTDTAVLGYQDMGDIVSNSANPSITIPVATGAVGLWYSIIFIGTGTCSIYITGSGTPDLQLLNSEAVLYLSDGTNWYTQRNMATLTATTPLAYNSGVISLQFDQDSLVVDVYNRLRVKANTFEAYGAVSTHESKSVYDALGVHGLKLDTAVNGLFLKYNSTTSKYEHTSVAFSDLSSTPTTLTGYGITDAYTESEVDTLLTGKANTSHTQAFSTITDTPTTLAGYGITDACTPNHHHSISEVDELQTTLDSKASVTSVNNLIAINTDTFEPSGFIDRTQCTISVNDTTREVTISAVSGNYYYYVSGVKYTKTSESIIFDNTIGTHYIYYNSSGTLTKSMVAWDIVNTAQIVTVYWTGTTARLYDERHGCIMDGRTHEYLHKTIGARYSSGFAGTFDNTTFATTAGVFFDEDIRHDIVTKSQLRVFYRNSTAFNWTALQSLYYYSSGGNVYYDNAGTITAVGNSKYVAYWIFATNDLECPIISLMGQRQDNTIAEARTNNTYETINFGNLPYVEFKLLYRVILQNDATPYVEATDFRTASLVATGSYVATSHSTLSGLTNLDHPASAIVNTPNGDISSTTVQNAINELDSEKMSITPDYINFNTAIVTEPTGLGNMYWDNKYSTVSINLSNDVVLQVGQEQLIKAVNSTGTTIANGKLVHVIGALGNKPKIELSDMTDLTQDCILGMATEDILNNENGFVCTSGIVRGLNTTGIAEGTRLYASSNGDYTTTVPTYGYRRFPIGMVIKEHGTDGWILVKINEIPYMFGDIPNGDYSAFDGTGNLTMNNNSLYLIDDDMSGINANGLTTATFGKFTIDSSTNGGLDIWGVSDTDHRGLVLIGLTGSTTPTSAYPIVIAGGKSNVSGTGYTTLANTEKLLAIENWGTNVFTMNGRGTGTFCPTTYGISIGNDNEIWFGNSYDATCDGYINYRGFNGADSRNRNLNICDGKYGTIATFTGSDKSTTFNGQVNVNGTTCELDINSTLQSITSTIAVRSDASYVQLVKRKSTSAGNFSTNVGACELTSVGVYDFVIGTYNSAPLIFGTNNTQRAVINGSGTATFNFSNTSGYALTLNNIVGAGDVNRNVLYLDAYRSDTNNTKLIGSRDDKFTVTSNGVVTATTFVGALTGIASGCLPLTGGTLTGDLTINKDAGVLYFNHLTTSSYNQIRFDENGVYKSSISSLGSAWDTTYQRECLAITATKQILFTSSSEMMLIDGGGIVSRPDYNGVATLNLNYNGYLNSTTQFRNTNVCDGKNSTIVSFAGSDKSTTFYGAININGNLIYGLDKTVLSGGTNIITLTISNYAYGSYDINLMGRDTTAPNGVTFWKGLLMIYRETGAVTFRLNEIYKDYMGGTISDNLVVTATAGSGTLTITVTPPNGDCSVGGTITARHINTTLALL